MELEDIRLEIAKAAISAGLSLEEAQKWSDWVTATSNNTVEAFFSEEPDDDQLEEALWDQFGGYGGISWIDFIRDIRCESHLSLKMAIGCCLLYGIRKKPRTVIIDAIESKAVDGYIPYGMDGYGHFSIGSGKYHINKISLIQWLESSHHFCGKGIVKQFWVQKLSKPIMKESGVRV